MKKTIIVLAVLFTSIIVAQDAYTKGMQKAFQLWEESKALDASNMFERISKAETDNWLPYYYVAQINIIASFGEQDMNLLKQKLDKAQEFIDLAKAISPNNSEIIVQQARVHMAWISFDGATYGMTLSGKVAALLAEAQQLTPENPRVVLSKADWDMGFARYFGKDTAPYCKDVERSLELFDTFKAATDFHPNWGKDRAEQVLEDCK